MSRMVSFFVLIAIILVIGFLFFRVMAPFLLPLFLAALLVVIFHPLHQRMLSRCGDRQRLASALTTLVVMLIVLLPTLFVIVMAAAEGSAMVARLNPSELRHKVGRARDQFMLLQMPHAERIRAIEAGLSALIAEPGIIADQASARSQVRQLTGQLDQLRSEFKVTTEATGPEFDAIRATLDSTLAASDGELSEVQFRDALRTASSQFHDLKMELLGGEFRAWIKELANPTDEDIQQRLRQTLDQGKGVLFSIGGRTTALIGRLAIGVVIAVVAMFFFLAEGPAMVATVMRLSPLDDRYEQELLNDFTSVSRAVVVATLLSALAQGLLGGIGYYFAGFDSVILMILLTGLLAMIPFVGAAAVWVPASLWLYFIEERTAAAILLALYGVAVISSVDNLIKPLVLHGKSRLHPLLALLSVLGGMNALGPIGILVGPMIVAFLQTLLNILHRELTQFDLERRSRAGHAPSSG